MYTGQCNFEIQALRLIFPKPHFIQVDFFFFSKERGARKKVESPGQLLDYLHLIVEQQCISINLFMAAD